MSAASPEMLDAFKTEPFAEVGWVWVNAALSQEQQAQLAAFTDELCRWPDIPGTWLRYFEQTSAGRQLARVENFTPYHPGLCDLLLSADVLAVVAACLGEPAVLFKDKINIRFPGSAPFPAHQDAPAYRPFGVHNVVTVMYPIDSFTTNNGALEFTDSGAHELLPQGEDRNIASDTANALAFRPVLAQRGDIVVFNTLVPHRSGPNLSTAPRRTYFLTFNAASEGDHRQRYFHTKRELFPPEAERVPGKNYDSTGALFRSGNPYD